MVFCAAQGLHALAVGATGGVDVLSNGGAADKADGFDARVGQQCVNRFFVAIDHIEHARWETCLQR